MLLEATFLPADLANAEDLALDHPMPRRAPPPPARRHPAYGQDTRRWPAALASAAIVAGLFSVLAWMNVTPPTAHAPHIVALTLRIDPPRSTPHPKPQQQHTPPATSASPAPAPTPAPPPVAAILAPTAVPAPAPVAAPAPAPAPAAIAAPAPAAPTDAGDLSTHMLSFTPPTYPLDARRAHDQGTVVLALLLAADGTVARIDIAKSSGHPRLDQAALAAVRQWRWKPTLRDGQPTQVRGTVRIPFVLKP